MPAHCKCKARYGQLTPFATRLDIHPIGEPTPEPPRCSTVRDPKGGPLARISIQTPVQRIVQTPSPTHARVLLLALWDVPWCLDRNVPA